MPKLRLFYFNARARAEPARLVLAVAGVDYEDVRYTGEEWAAQKATGKFILGQMPCLETEDGVMLAQSKAITRYIANEYNLAGKTNLEKAKADMVMDTCQDLLQGMVKVHFEKDEAKKSELKTEYGKTVVSTMAALEKILSANNGGDGFFVGDGVTFADLAFYAQMEYLLAENAQLLDGFPKLKALNARVAALPKVAAWLENRPKSEF